MSAETVQYYRLEEPAHSLPELKLAVNQDTSLLLMHVLLEDAAGHVLSYADKDRHPDGRPRFFANGYPTQPVTSCTI